MLQKDLHHVIADLLNTVGKPLKIRKIVELIAKDNLYVRPKDGKLPDYNQIWGRIGQNPYLFNSEDNLVTLKPQRDYEQRMFRLTWNTRGWEIPINHNWKKDNQGDSNIAFENQYGFGGEEWLFNMRYQENGYQYGYIRGALELAINVDYLNIAYLFTINQETKERYLVGKIEYLEIIKAGSEAEAIAEHLYAQYLKDFQEEIKAAGGDLTGVDIEGIQANVRFKFTVDELYAKPILIPGLKGRKYNRFKPYKVDHNLQMILYGCLPTSKFDFRAGVAKNTSGYERFTTPAYGVVKRHHSAITNAVEKYLKPQYSIQKGNISIESTFFGSNIADVVLKHKAKEISIIEAKTSGIARKNIREAMGQLLDYAFWYEDVKVKRLIIVSPTPLTDKELGYLSRLQRSLNTQIAYWQYVENAPESQAQIVELF